MKTVALALQGGGAHGAFVWGVLDRLCQERQLKIAVAGRLRPSPVAPICTGQRVAL